MQLWYWKLGLDFGRITKWSPETELENKHDYSSSLGFAIEHDDKLYESILRLKHKDYLKPLSYPSNMTQIRIKDNIHLFVPM